MTERMCNLAVLGALLVIATTGVAYAQLAEAETPTLT